jgi:hypothetical protein
MTYGVCKLTGNTGNFVRCHLIPRALTRPSFPGQYFISGGPGIRPKKSWTSWYDEQLVIRKGERILADYDDWGIRELRRLELVWSGWGAKTSLPVEKSIDGEPGFGFRVVECADPAKLRLFFLSLLWRAAATNRSEFEEINLEQDELERLRTMVRDGNPEPLEFFPINLLQIVARADPHNLGPMARDYGEGLPAFRFYFDGLIIIMLRQFSGEWKKLGRAIVGISPILHVQTQTWEVSLQRQNQIQHIVEATRQWPEVARKLAGDKRGNRPRPEDGGPV